MEAKIGHIAFLVGIAISVLSGLFPMQGDIASMMSLLLVVLGLIVGFLNVTSKETVEFLVAAIALLGASAAGVGLNQITLLGLGPKFVVMLTQVSVFVAPAALVVSLKAVWSLAQD